MFPRALHAGLPARYRLQCDQKEGKAIKSTARVLDEWPVGACESLLDVHENAWTWYVCTVGVGMHACE